MTEAEALALADRIAAVGGYTVLDTDVFHGRWAIHIREHGGGGWSQWVHTPERWADVEKYGFAALAERKN